MAFLHPNHFPFCFGKRSGNLSFWQGPYSLEQAMALFWMVKSITISGTQKGPEDFPYSFTFTGPNTMSELVCPDSETFNNAFGWREIFPPPPLTVFDDPVLFELGGGSIAKGVAFENKKYYVYVNLRLAADEGAPILSNSQTFNITKTLKIIENRIEDNISVPITFNTIFDIYTSEIDSFTCTLRDPS